MRTHVEKQPELPPDMQRLNIALHRLYEHAIRRALEAEAQEVVNESTRSGLAAGERVLSEKGVDGSGEHTTSLTGAL